MSHRWRTAPDVSRSQVAALRRREQTAAAKQVGVHDVRFLGYPDGQVEATLGLRRDRSGRSGPTVSSASPPSATTRGLGPVIPDHRAVGSASLDAVYPDARNPFTFPELLADEGLEAWTAREVWIAEGPTPNHYVDVTMTLPRKIAALRAHESQVEEGLEDFLGWLARSRCRPGWPARGALAEAFQVLNTG